MSINIIENILKSKPHNPHHLNRYIKFINFCLSNPSTTQYTEEHHICPKAKDLFPEYKSFRKHPWNKIKLSMEQHLLAHLMLWKAYGGSQAYSIHYMINVAGEKKRIPTKFIRQYNVKLKTENRINRKGKAVYKDQSGNKFLLNSNDPLIKELNLVGNNMGHVMDNESKENMCRAKDRNRRITLYFLNMKITFPWHDSRLPELIEQGWLPYKMSAEIEFMRSKAQAAAMSEVLTGTCSYYYPDGKLYGRISKTDPVIQELGLIYISSEKQRAQSSAQAHKNAKDPSVQMKKSATLSTLKWCHDPINRINSRLTLLPDGWVLGKLKIKPAVPKTTYNDGVRNYMLKEGEIPEPHWKLGMAPQKQRSVNFTNGVDWISLVAGQTPPAGYVRGKKPRSHKKYP